MAIISREIADHRIATVEACGGNIREASRRLKIDRSTLTDSLATIERFYGIKPGIRLAIGGASPMSEDTGKFHEEWTAQDCINELVRVCEIDTDKVITRNYFRVHSEISESTWNRYFGTFLEFKRQAEIILSRHSHGLERHIAKHASVDKMRVLNAGKREWEDKYLRPASGRWQTVLVGSDQHDMNCDPFYRRLFIETAIRVQPEKIVLNGDLFDLPEFSKHTQDPREFHLLKRIAWVHEFLRELRNGCPNAEIILIEGNHEFRLLRHMGEETPALRVVLADLHGFTVSTLLKLDQFEINYIARADMTAWNESAIKEQLRKNYAMLYDNSLLFGHYPQMRDMGIPGSNGHHHKHVVWPGYSPNYGPFEWHQTGSGHKREASYCAAEKWGIGFMLAHLDTLTKRTQFEYFDLSHDHCFIGGRMYRRDTFEGVLDLPMAA